MAYQMARAISDIRRRRGRPQTRWIDVVRTDLRKIGLTLAEAEQAALDKKAWISTADRCVRAWEHPWLDRMVAWDPHGNGT